MKIIKDGSYLVKGRVGTGGGASVVYLSGTAGGATVTLGYYDDYETFIPLVTGLLTVGEQYTVEQGGSAVNIYAMVASATGTTALSLLVNGKA